MLRNFILTLIIIIATIATALWLLNGPETGNGRDEHEEHEAAYDRGPHNGRLLEADELALEITIYENGIAPEFHVYPYFQGRPVDPGRVDLKMELARTGDVSEAFQFEPRGEYLRGDKTVAEPHSFDVSVMAGYQGKSFRWDYANYEGRTQIATELASEAGIVTEIAGPATITETLPLTGRVQIDPNRLSQVTARFTGVVQNIYVELGEYVNTGARMLTVQSNESLQNYPVNAPINGLVIKRNVQVGEVTSEEPLFTIVDLSQVWVELDIFARDVGKVKVGQAVNLETLDGITAEGVIDWLAPLSSHASQSIHARVPIHNSDGKFRPGQFVSAKVTVATRAVPLAVKRSAVQRFRDFQVVYARFGEIYEVRMLEAGPGNEEWLEIIGGLASGTEYVTENSYLIKADIEKSGATHDH